jgi:biopolymer transport protein ExbD|tara:strand:+ start:932 stop:1330 length:399 start_codon:yes stop_codon:yes gene_type:complete
MEILNLLKKIVFYLLILLVTVLVFYQLYLIINAPKFKKSTPLNISATVINDLSQNNFNQNATQLSDDEFSYTIVGYRAGKKNSSVVLRKNNVDYVVQQGELIDNTYRLISVSTDEIVFDRAGQKRYIKIERK